MAAVIRVRYVIVLRTDSDRFGATPELPCGVVGESFAEVNGVRLCYEVLGEPDRPVVC